MKSQLPETVIAAANVMMKLGEYDQAIKLLESKRSQFPNDPELLRALSKAHSLYGKPEQRIEFFESVRGSNTPEYLARLGESYRQASRYPEATLALEESLDMNPTDYEAWFSLGRCHEQMGELDKAIEAYEKSYEQSLDDPVVKIYLATAHEKKGDIDVAKTMYEEVLKKYPYNPQALAGVKLCSELQANLEPGKEGNLLESICQTGYHADFTRSLLIALSIVAHADHKLAPEELHFIHARLQPFEKIMEKPDPETLKLPYELEDLREAAEPVPSHARSYLFRLACELAATDRALTTDEDRVLKELYQVLEISADIAEPILAKTRPITWIALYDLKTTFMETLKMEDLDKLLLGWERYRNSYWDKASMPITDLITLLEKARSELEVSDPVKPRKYRFRDNVTAIRLQSDLRLEVFANGSIIPTASLSGDDLEERVMTLYSWGQKERAKELSEMILANRIILALETFCRLMPTRGWTDPAHQPPEMEMIFTKPDKALKVARAVEAGVRDQGSGIRDQGLRQ